jgi:histone demethylase JARID1
MKLPPPFTQTLFVELVRFVPGQPDNVTVSGSSSRTSSTPMARQPATPIEPSHSRPIHVTPGSPATSVQTTFDVTRASATSHHVPPPPWSRWGTMSTPSRPPSTQRRQPPGETPRGTPQPSRKRKHIDPSEDPAVATSSTRRRILPQAPVPQHLSSAPKRPVQTLSPSLAMIVSPDIDSSPRPMLSFVSPSSSPRQAVRTVKLVMTKGK